MPPHAFVDEINHPQFLLVAATVSSTDVASTRAAISALLLPGQRRIHFKDERVGRKRAILETVAGCPVAARLYECRGERRELPARARCLARLVADLSAMQAERLVVELDESVLRHDLRTLYSAVQQAGVRNRLTYHHLRAPEDPLLAIPDAVAWSWAKGGEWRRRIQPVIADHIQV